MAETIAGTYMPSSTNHGRGVYRRVDPPSEDSKVLLYYWDQRDGEANCGWWFGPEVGGEEVWAHNAGTLGNALPPISGWVVLHSGQVDPGLTVTKVEGPRTTATPSTAQPRPPGIQGGPRGPSAFSAPPRPRGSAGAMPPRPTPSAAASGLLNTGPPAPRPRFPGFGPSSGGVGPSSGGAAGAKRPRYDNARASELRGWLEGLDDGVGAMVQYFDVLATEFDADLAQIAAAKVEGGEKLGILGVVDPSFWDTVRVTKAGHKMLFARGIAKL
mmetsp:Transcript_78494/g.217959  ORF Transcript_78494/g.217959 Transcript_78494/m.217959 type:complete len:271 (+) Transcript_78494:75-887(+)